MILAADEDTDGRRPRWTVYLLASPTRTYVGVTTDVRRRLAQHNGTVAGGARSTRAGRPWRVAAKWGPFASRGEALKIEYQLKQRPARERRRWKSGTLPAAAGDAARPGS